MAAAAAKEKDPDPDGEQLAKTAQPLEAAVKLVRMLKEHSGDRLRTHVLAFEVRYRRPQICFFCRWQSNRSIFGQHVETADQDSLWTCM